MNRGATVTASTGCSCPPARIGHRVDEERDVVTQLPEQQRLVDTEGARAEDADALPADLPPVAVGAVQHESPQPQSPATGQIHLESAVTTTRANGTVVEDLRSVVLRLSSPGPEHLVRRKPLSCEDVVRAAGRSIPWFAGIHDDHRT